MITSSPNIKIKLVGNNRFICSYNGIKNSYNTPKYPVTLSNIAEILELVTHYFISDRNLFPLGNAKILTYCEIKENTEYLVVITLE